MTLNLFDEDENIQFSCQNCANLICLREFAINLALGHENTYYCLHCLSQREEQNPMLILKQIKSYIKQRDCLNKEWIKYNVIDECPKSKTCLPDECFK